MIKTGQIDDLKRFGFHYITSITKEQIRSLLKTGVMQLELFDSKLVEVKDEEGVRYVLKKNPVRAREIRYNRFSKLRKIKNEIKKTNEYLKDHPRAKSETGIKKIQKLIR
jgi:hypothetical protein